MRDVLVLFQCPAMRVVEDLLAVEIDLALVVAADLHLDPIQFPGSYDVRDSVSDAVVIRPIQNLVEVEHVAGGRHLRPDQFLVPDSHFLASFGLKTGLTLDLFPVETVVRAVVGSERNGEEEEPLPHEALLVDTGLLGRCFLSGNGPLGCRGPESRQTGADGAARKQEHCCRFQLGHEYCPFSGRRPLITLAANRNLNAILTDLRKPYARPKPLESVPRPALRASRRAFRRSTAYCGSDRGSPSRNYARPLNTHLANGHL